MADYMAGFYPDWVDKEENPRQLAVEYYAPLFLLISMFDKTGENGEYATILHNHTEHFMQRYGVDSNISFNDLGS